jgi:hypothetical protein
MLLKQVSSASYHSFNIYKQKNSWVLCMIHCVNPPKSTWAVCMNHPVYTPKSTWVVCMNHPVYPPKSIWAVYESLCISPKIDLGCVYESPCISPILTIYFYDMYKTPRQHSEDATCKFINLTGWLVRVWTSDNQRYCTTVICRTAPHQDPSSLPFP